MWCFGKLTSGCKKMEAFRLILSFKLLWSSSLGSRAVVGVQIIWLYYSHKIWTSTTVAITSCVCVISYVPWSKLVLLTSSNKGLANEWLVSGEIVWNRIRGIISQGGLSLPNTMILFLTIVDMEAKACCCLARKRDRACNTANLLIHTLCLEYFVGLPSSLCEEIEGISLISYFTWKSFLDPTSQDRNQSATAWPMHQE